MVKVKIQKANNKIYFIKDHLNCQHKIKFQMVLSNNYRKSFI